MGLCRLCANDCTDNGRFADRIFREKVLDIICMWVDVDDCSVTTDVCTSCYLRVNEFYSFKHDCRSLQLKFKAMQKKSRTKGVIKPIKVKPIKQKALKESKPPPAVPKPSIVKPRAKSRLIVKPSIRKFKEAVHLPPEEYRLYALRNYSYKKRTIMCEQCGRSIELNRVEGHRNRHLGVQPFECETCGDKFHCKINLRTHCRRLHVQGQETVCPVCEKTFPSKLALRSHRYKIHAERKFQCPECQQKFTTKSDLVFHLKIHNQTRDFPCTLCPKAFYSKTVWRIHMRTHTGERPYRCDVCDAAYVHRNMYVAHMTKNHPGRPLMVLNGRQAAKETYNENL